MSGILRVAPGTLKCCVTVSLILAVVVSIGCGRNQKLVTEYGKVSGVEGSTSVNGTGIFLGMFRARGHTVKRYRNISPRLKKYQTVVWFPDNDKPPGEEAVTALEDWLREGFQRTLIYVGRDFDAELDYLQGMADRSDVSNRDEVWRQLAEVKLQHDQRRIAGLNRDDQPNCRWFDQQSTARHKAKRLSGPLANGVNSNDISMELATVLVPSKKITDLEWIDVKPLLTADEVDFVYSIAETAQAHDSSDVQAESKIIVVSNGSFLLNYGLVNREHRKLAGALIDQTYPAGKVAFLESGPAGISVTNQSSINHNSWAWISEPPLRYIVPHFLLWGVLFCFVFYPIFGRPRRHKPKPVSLGESSSSSAATNEYAESTTSFRSHIVAMGKLLERTKQPDLAAEKVRHYHELHGRDANLKQDRK